MARRIAESTKRALFGAKSMRAMKAMENLENARGKLKGRNAAREKVTDVAIKNLRATEAWIEARDAARARAEEVLESTLRHMAKGSRLIDVPVNASPEKVRLIALEAAQRNALGRKQKTVVRLLTIIQDCKTQRKRMLVTAEEQRKIVTKQLRS